MIAVTPTFISYERYKKNAWTQFEEIGTDMNQSCDAVRDTGA